jgi:hypothetical protein
MGLLREIIDLDRSAVKGHGLERRKLYVYDDKLWEVPDTGCVVCDAAGKEQTLRCTDDPDLSVCLEHGPLAETKLVERITRTIELAGAKQVRRARRIQHVLIPTSREKTPS